MTLGALGGAVRPLTRSELLELPPAVNLATLGRALGLSEPTIREARRRGDLAGMGLRVLRLGHQYRIPAEDILRLLGITRNGEGGPDPPSSPPPTQPSAAAPSP